MLLTLLACFNSRSFPCFTSDDEQAQALFIQRFGPIDVTMDEVPECAQVFDRPWFGGSDILSFDPDLNSADGQTVPMQLVDAPKVVHSPDINIVRMAWEGNGEDTTFISTLGDIEIISPDNGCLLYTSPSPRDA